MDSGVTQTPPSATNPRVRTTSTQIDDATLTKCMHQPRARIRTSLDPDLMVMQSSPLDTRQFRITTSFDHIGSKPSVLGVEYLERPRRLADSLTHRRH